MARRAARGDGPGTARLRVPGRDLEVADGYRGTHHRHAEGRRARHRVAGNSARSQRLAGEEERPAPLEGTASGVPWGVETMP